MSPEYRRRLWCWQCQPVHPRRSFQPGSQQTAHSNEAVSPHFSQAAGVPGCHAGGSSPRPLLPCCHGQGALAGDPVPGLYVHSSRGRTGLRGKSSDGACFPGTADTATPHTQRSPALFLGFYDELAVPCIFIFLWDIRISVWHSGRLVSHTGWAVAFHVASG